MGGWVFDYLPQILAYMLPGIVGFKTFSLCCKLRSGSLPGDWQKTLVFSLILGGIINIVVEAFVNKDTTNPNLLIACLVVVAAIIGFIAAKIIEKRGTNELLEKSIGKSLAENIWFKAFPPSINTNIEITTTYRNHPAMIQGRIIAYYPEKSGECRILLTKCSIKYLDDDYEMSPDVNASMKIYVYTKDIKNICIMNEIAS